MERGARTGGRLDCQILAALKAQQEERVAMRDRTSTVRLSWSL